MTKVESSLVTPPELHNELLNKADLVRKMKTVKVTPEGEEDVHPKLLLLVSLLNRSWHW